MSDEEQQHKYESNNLKIAITAIVSVLLGSAFLLALINFGMNVQKDIDAKTEQKKESEKVVSIINVDYSAASFSYIAPQSNGPMTEEEFGNLPKNALISSIKEDYDENYLVIDNQDLLDRALDKIRRASGDESISYTVEEKFFSSGSIIMITHESSGIVGLPVSGVSRDENYNIQIDATVKKGESKVADSTEGFATFVKIRNIQPNSVKVKIEE